jgi:hypothetical protein
LADVVCIRFLLAALAGWLNRQPQDVIEYLLEENRTLRGQLGGRRVRLTDEQRRRRLAVRGQRLGPPGVEPRGDDRHARRDF